jgi:hypothetical protein
MPSVLRFLFSLATLAHPALAFAQTAPAKAPVAIPEPAALALFVLGVGVVGAAMRRRQD